MVLGWTLIVLIIYGLFFFKPVDQVNRPCLGRKSLKRLYEQEYGESPYHDDDYLDARSGFE